MGKRQREWARRRYTELIILLGGKCVVCGTTKQLELDCIFPQGSKHHKMEWSWRVSFYNQQYRIKNLQVLCERHNTKKASTDADFLPGL